MKTLILALSTVALAATSTVKAEFFSPNVVSGAVIGGVAGAVIGNNSGSHRGGEGAAIGAVAGGLIGASVDQNRTRVSVYAPPPAPVYIASTCAPTVVYTVPAPVVVYRQPTVVYERPTVVYARPYDRFEYRTGVRVYIAPNHRDHDRDHDSRNDHEGHRW